MKITVKKIKRELKKQYGWENLDCEDHKWFVDGLIKDTISAINYELLKHKNISIKDK